MLGEYAAVDGGQGIHAREAKGKHTEVALETRVDGKRACCGVHAGHILCVVDLLEAELLAVIPVVVVQMLADESVGLYCEVLVHLVTKQTTIHSQIPYTDPLIIKSQL